MKRGAVIFAFGLALAVAGYSCAYLSGTSSARMLQRTPQPELAWLKEEFKLNDAEFRRIADLHSGYLPRCREKCIQIDAQNVALQNLLAAATNVTLEIEHALTERARIRSECQTMMLKHFFEVSQTMPPEQGRRYLAWVQKKAFLPDYGMESRNSSRNKSARVEAWDSPLRLALSALNLQRRNSEGSK